MQVIVHVHVIQQDLLNVAQWCDSNALTINMKKTKLMLFGTRASIKKHKLMPVLLNQNPIEFTNNYKYLGVILDSSLSFSKFVTNIIKTTTHKAYVLSKIRCYLNTQTCLSIYKSMVMPLFDYGDVLYAASKSQLSKLQRIQNRCLRICTNSARRTNNCSSSSHY